MVTPGILHIGVGNFHRAHQAYYIDQVMNQDPKNPEVLKWGIVGASLFDGRKRDALEPQGWLQTLVARDNLGTKAQVLGSMVDYLPYDEERKNLREALTDPDIKIVSLTITEGGYFLKDEQFDHSHPEIQHDIQNPEEPKTSFGVIVKALDVRRKADTKPFTVMCCDNLPHNGDVTRTVTVGLATRMVGAEFGRWIEENVAFPNSMVDRITPQTTEEGKAYVKDTYGIDDVMPVFWYVMFIC
jgi:mannitol 2-dehydrogenase